MARDPHNPLRLGPAAGLALAAWLAGCAEPAGPAAPITVADVAGTYDLRTIDGQGPPWRLAVDGLDTRRAERMTLRADGTLTVTITRDSVPAGVPATVTGGGATWGLVPDDARAPAGGAVLRTTAIIHTPYQTYPQELDYRIEARGGALRLVGISPSYAVEVYDRAP